MMVATSPWRLCGFRLVMASTRATAAQVRLARRSCGLPHVMASRCSAARRCGSIAVATSPRRSCRLPHVMASKCSTAGRRCGSTTVATSRQRWCRLPHVVASRCSRAARRCGSVRSRRHCRRARAVSRREDRDAFDSGSCDHQGRRAHLAVPPSSMRQVCRAAIRCAPTANGTAVFGRLDCGDACGGRLTSQAAPRSLASRAAGRIRPATS